MSLPLIPMHSVVLGVLPRIDVLEIVHRLARIHIHIVPFRFLIHPVTDGILERIAWVQHHTPMLEPQLILGCAVSHLTPPTGVFYKSMVGKLLITSSTTVLVSARRCLSSRNASGDNGILPTPRNCPSSLARTASIWVSPVRLHILSMSIMSSTPSNVLVDSRFCLGLPSLRLSVVLSSRLWCSRSR